MTDFDLVVVGGGHAGVEAALAVARMGSSAAIITMDRTRLAMMSCNPAIGGLGKSQLVKEIDALGGIMGEAADATGIQFRKLNLSRGPAVWATRIQCDRRNYNQFVVDRINDVDEIEVIEGLACAILHEHGRTIGVALESGQEVRSRAVLLATGTFLGGLIHIGEKKMQAGRIGEKAAYGMSESLASLGFELGRLKTGTPPRIDGRTIDWSRCEVQPGDEPLPFFSRRSIRAPFTQIPCHLTYTTAATREIILANVHRSPMFSGQIHGIGPRYCPSIEDKFFRFADKASHQIFLEPEGNGTDEIYPNGFSTSLPEDVQLSAMRTVVGLEEVMFTRPGYAVEYDYCPAHQIKPTMETRRLAGLYFAGQINGTSGYEEAAGQGLIAGINAILKLRDEEPLILDRSEGYVGVMVDDLTTRSTTEPYRLFTSRAEYRLSLREDNACDRLHRYAVKYGLLAQQIARDIDTLFKSTDSVLASLKGKSVSSRKREGVEDPPGEPEKIPIARYLTNPEVTISMGVSALKEHFPDAELDVLERAAIHVKYSGYVNKQERELVKFRKLEEVVIPEDFSYDSVTGLKREAHEKFTRFQPRSLGQAGRIEGVTPGDVAVLSVFLKRHRSLSTTA